MLANILFCFNKAIWVTKLSKHTANPMYNDSLFITHFMYFILFDIKEKAYYLETPKYLYFWKNNSNVFWNDCFWYKSP